MKIPFLKLILKIMLCIVLVLILGEIFSPNIREFCVSRETLYIALTVSCQLAVREIHILEIHSVFLKSLNHTTRHMSSRCY